MPEVIKNKQDNVGEKERSLLMLMQKIEGRGDIDLSENQINEIIKQRGDVNQYIHTERMQDHERFKI